MVRDRAAQNEPVSRNWAGELSASGRWRRARKAEQFQL